MANPDQIAVLLLGTVAWASWRRKHRADSVDLSGANLRGANLSKANLSGVDLRGANLVGTDLGEANLSGADIRKANLSGADLRDANLREANLSGADLREANLAGTYLRRANFNVARLSKANLRGADISKANLRGADLKEASLREANLSFADLCGAGLIGAGLSGADLSGARLREADLRGANLNGADLREAHLSGADLTGADLGRASLFLTDISGLDLSQARNLAEVRHLGPSHVGTDTLEQTAVGLTENRSQQGEVEAFFRGAGVSERYMETFGYSIGQAIEFYSCFISYSSEDKAFARRLYDGLQGQGIRCWLDEHQLLPGDDIYEQIDRGIRLWDKVLLCCSEASLASWWVEKEIKKALNKEQDIRKQQGRKALALIPLCLDPTLFKWEDGLASIILERHAADFTGWEKESTKFDEQFIRVVQALRTDEGSRPKPPKPKL